jgi:plasmid maintenance system antidote protein VapI
MGIAKNRIKEFLNARADFPEFEALSYKASFNTAKGWLTVQLKDINIHIEPPVLNNIINNKRNLTVKEAFLISLIFGVEPFEILEGFDCIEYYEMFKKEQRKIDMKQYTNPINI